MEVSSTFAHRVHFTITVHYHGKRDFSVLFSLETDPWSHAFDKMEQYEQSYNLRTNTFAHRQSSRHRGISFEIHAWISVSSVRCEFRDNELRLSRTVFLLLGLCERERQSNNNGSRSAFNDIIAYNHTRVSRPREHKCQKITCAYTMFQHVPLSLLPCLLPTVTLLLSRLSRVSAAERKKRRKRREREEERGS